MPVPSRHQAFQYRLESCSAVLRLLRLWYLCFPRGVARLENLCLSGGNGAVYDEGITKYVQRSAQQNQHAQGGFARIKSDSSLNKKYSVS